MEKFGKIVIIYALSVVVSFSLALTIFKFYWPPLLVSMVITGIGGLIVILEWPEKSSRGRSGKRHGWNEQEKEMVRDRQDGKCAKCGKNPPRWEYHHKDGNRSNNSLSNCQGLFPNCHSVETHD